MWIILSYLTEAVILLSRTSVEFHDGVMIDVSPEKVWHAATVFDNYKSWNSQ